MAPPAHALSDSWPLIAGSALAGAAVAIGATRLWSTVGSVAPSAEIEERSTTSSVGGGAAAYETRKAVDEYLQFHFGQDADVLPYAAGPQVR